MRRFIGRQPWAAAIGVAACLVIFTILLHFLAYRLAQGSPGIAFTWLAVAIEAAVALAIVRALRWWRSCGFTPPTEWREGWLLAILWIPVGFALLAFFRGIHTSIGPVLLLAGLSLLVGVNEETYFRGLVLRFLLPRGVLVAIVGSSILFGMAHVANLLTPGATALGVGFQMTSACLIGMFFAGVRLRMNAIWPLMAAHALVDFPILATTYPGVRLASPPIPALIVGLGIYGIFGVVGLILGRGAAEQVVRET